MRNARLVQTFARRNVAVAAALAISALAAAPMMMAASRALATPESVSEAPAAVGLRTAVEVAPVEAAPAAPCVRKVRVVYGGYGAPVGACAAR